MRFVGKLENSKFPHVVIPKSRPIGEIIDEEIEFIRGFSDFSFVVFTFHPEMGNHDFLMLAKAKIAFVGVPSLVLMIALLSPYAVA